jgi:hypothetical protein
MHGGADMEKFEAAFEAAASELAPALVSDKVRRALRKHLEFVYRCAVEEGKRLGRQAFRDQIDKLNKPELQPPTLCKSKKSGCKRGAAKPHQ